MEIITFRDGDLTETENKAITAGFKEQMLDSHTPALHKEIKSWIVTSPEEAAIGILKCKLFWDWLYISQLWVCDEARGLGWGKKLILAAEGYAKENKLTGLWLWTQSWQAEGFYQKLGYKEFTRFDNFPKEHSRIGLRKYLS